MNKYPRKIYWLPFIGRSLKHIDQSIKQFGLQEGWRHGLVDIKIKIKSELSSRTIKYLTDKPIILIGNHPHQLDLFALLASSPKRKNSFIVAMAEVVNLWPSIKPYSLKTYNIRNNWVDKVMMKIIGYLNHTRKMSKEESRSYNRQIIKKAAKKLKQGGLITIMPGPHTKRKDIWKNGLGYLIENALKNKTQVYLVNSYTNGSTSFDFLCFFPLLRKLLPTLNVFFSRPVLITMFPGENPREIVARYQNKYWRWVDKEVLV